MTYALLALAAALVALLTYRLWKLPQALAALPAALRAAQRQAPLKLIDGGLPPTGHMVFSGPLEHNEHGFITTPLVPCADPACHCRTMHALKN